MWRPLVAALCLAFGPCAEGITFEARGAPAAWSATAHQSVRSYPDEWEPQTEDICVWGALQKIPYSVRFIALLLGVMTGAVFVVGLKQWLVLARERTRLDALERECVPGLRDGRILDVLHAAARDAGNRFGQSLARAIRTLGVEPSGRLDPVNVQLARSDIRRERARHSAEARRGLSLLGSIAATATLLGLLSTIVGIMSAMQGMKTSEGTGWGAVAGGLSEAFVSAAAGIFVSLVAIWARKYLASRADALRLRLESITAAFEAYCLAREDRAVKPFNVFDATFQEAPRRSLGVLGAWR
jgi:biopolymer transport protein ExbB/TolQ